MVWEVLEVVVLDGGSWWGCLLSWPCLHVLLDDLEGLLWRGVVSWEVGLGGLEPGWWWGGPGHWGRLEHHLVEDLRRRRWRWGGVLDGNVVGGVVDDNLPGWGGLTSWGALEELVRLPVEFWGPWGRLLQIVLDDCLVEDVWGVGGLGGLGSRFPLDHRPLHGLGDVNGGLEEDDGAILLVEVLGGWGRGQADHFVVVVVDCLGLDLDLPVLLEVAITDVFVLLLLLLIPFLLALVWGEA